MLMQFKFDSNNLITPPKIALCKMDLEMLGYLEVNNVVIKPTFCSLTEISFTVYDGTYLYDSIRRYMVLEVDGFGRFQIEPTEEKDDGLVKYKEVTAYSYEVSLNKYTLSYKDNVQYELWNAVDEERQKKSLLGIITEQTGWTIAHFDASLLNHIRTMSIDKEEVYGLLMGNISEAFKCYFVFDTMNKAIYCYDRENEPVNSGINLSFRNLVNEINIKQSSDDITTALTVTGAEGVGINLVNPLGNNVIYDFHYYCNDEPWGMPKQLQEKVITWQNKIEENKSIYENVVSIQRTLLDELTALDGELNVLEGELKALVDVQSVQIAGNNNEGLSDTYIKIEKKEKEIADKTSEISVKLSLYQECVDSKSEIVKSLSFNDNFTDEEYELLRYHINSSVYENENFIFTDAQDEARKIEVSQELYNQGLKVMKKLSSPMYEFECNIAAFMFSKDYELFSKSLELGTSVNLELEDGVWVSPKLLQVVIDYDNPDNTTIILSDNYRLVDDVYEFSDGFNQTIKASRKSALSAPIWDEPNQTGFYSTVNDYITNALNLANQEIINATNQEFTLGSYGLRGKKYDDNLDTYDPHQVAMTNNVIAFTDNGWQSSKAALGKVTIGPTEYYGLVAEAVIGNLIAGEQLLIGNENNSFSLDAKGAVLKDADLGVVKDNTQILLSPTDGIKIRKKKLSSIYNTQLEILNANKSDYELQISEFEQLITDRNIDKTIDEYAAEYNSITNGNIDYHKRNFFVFGEDMINAGWTEFPEDSRATTYYVQFKYSNENNPDGWTVYVSPIIDKIIVLSPDELRQYCDSILTPDKVTTADILSADTRELIGYIYEGITDDNPIEEQLADIKENHIILVENEYCKEELAKTERQIRDILYKSDSDLWEDVFFANADGDLTIKGFINAEQGSNIAGWITTADSFSAPASGDYISSNGTGKLSLMTWGTNYANFDGNIYAKNLYPNSSQVGEDYQIFKNGSMAGSWLTNNSIHPDKRAVSEWDDLYATRAYIEEAYVKTASIDELFANLIVTKDLITSTGTFKGNIEIGVGDGGKSKIFSEERDIDARHRLRRLFIESKGGVEIFGDYGGITIYPGVNDSGNNYATVAGNFRTHGHCDFWGDVSINGNIYVSEGGQDRVGVDGEWTISGHRIKVISGVIVEFT